MSDRKFPASYYKHLHRAVYANSEQECAALERDGWTSDYRALPKQSFPHDMYSPEGRRVIVGDYTVNVRYLQVGNTQKTMRIEEGRVDEDEAKQLAARLTVQGYTRKPPVNPVVQPTDPKDVTRLDMLERTVNVLERTVNEYRGMLEEIMEHLRQSQSVLKRGRKSEPAEVA